MKRWMTLRSAGVALAAAAFVFATGCGTTTASGDFASDEVHNIGVPAALTGSRPHTVFSPDAGGNAFAGAGRVVMPGEWAWGRNDGEVGVRFIPLAQGPRGAVVEGFEHIYERDGKVRTYGRTWIRTWSVNEAP